MVRLGSVHFSESLKWIPKNGDIQVLGSDTQTMGGNIVSIRTERKEEFRTYQFGEITFADWRVLKEMAESSLLYDFKPDPNAPVYKVRFAQHDPLQIYQSNSLSERISGGEIRLIFSVEGRL